MKKLTLTALFVSLSLSALPVAEAPAPAQIAAPHGALMASGAAELAALESSLLMVEIPHCGDFCTTPGVSRGCIDTSTGVWQRVICTCINNTWTC